jgi:hypothetical protein
VHGLSEEPARAQRTRCGAHLRPTRIAGGSTRRREGFETESRRRDGGEHGATGVR